MTPAGTPAPDQRLGEIAYTAYWRVLAPLCLPWVRVTRDEKRAWQAAARAAIRAWDGDTHQVAQRWEEGRD